MNITREDFYCGAFLSVLLNNGIVPALFEKREDSSRKIYDFETDKGDFIVYVKFTEKPSSENKSKKSYLWSFPFTESQIDEIKNIETSGKRLYFAFVSGKKSLTKSRIAIVSKNIVFQCMDLKRIDKYKKQFIKIRLIKRHREFDVYGTVSSDKVAGKDNTLKVPVKNINEIFGKQYNDVVVG